MPYCGIGLLDAFPSEVVNRTETRGYVFILDVVFKLHVNKQCYSSILMLFLMFNVKGSSEFPADKCS